MYATHQQLQAAAVAVDLHAAVRGERGYAESTGVAAIGARVAELRPHRELAATLARSVALEGPDGEACVVDGASPGLARAHAVVPGLGDRKAAQAVVGAELEDDDGWLLGQLPVDAREAGGGGVSADALARRPSRPAGWPWSARWPPGRAPSAVGVTISPTW